MITKISRGSQYFIFDEEMLRDILDNKNVLCNEQLDAEPFAFVVYSKFQDMKDADDFICISKVSDKHDRFLRKSIRVIVPEGTRYLEIFPYSYAEIKEVFDEELDEYKVSILLPNNDEILLKNVMKIE